MQFNSRDEFRFGPKHFLCETVFALDEYCENGITGDNFLAIFDTASVSRADFRCASAATGPHKNRDSMIAITALYAGLLALIFALLSFPGCAGAPGSASSMVAICC